jgi:hypothetical protein
MGFEFVALIVSAASFMISVAALWATALKRARIGLHHAAKNDRWAVSSWIGLTPSGEAHVTVALYAHNGGANSGIVETLTVSSEGTLGGVLEQPVQWYPVKTKPDSHPGNYAATFPCALDAGEIEELFLVGRAHLSLSPMQRLVADESADREREESFARQLATAQSLEVHAAWTYARPGGVLRSSKPKVVARGLELDVSVDRLRDAFVQLWSERATHPEYGERATRLAAIANGAEPSKPDAGATA